MLELLLLVVLVFSIISVQGQLSVTWNGTTITGPVLIYSDELPVDPSANTIGDTNGPGALICRSEDRARVSWHYVNGSIVRGPEHNDTFKAIRTGEEVTPSLAQLLLNRANTETANPDLNGVWHCRLNAMGSTEYDEQINVGIYSRGGGNISADVQVSLHSSSFGLNPPTFTLVGDTHGGPPTTYIWTWNGEMVIDGGPYNISIAVNGDSETAYQQSHYRSTLTVTGTLPGLYEYCVINRATNTMMTSTIFNITEAAQVITNLTAVQNDHNRVLVSWTAPHQPVSLSYRVTAEPGGINVDNAISPQPITLQPGVYNISVMTPSAPHYGGTAGPVQVTVRGELAPNVATSSLTATSLTVSWNQPLYSFTPVDYRVTLIRITGSGQDLCSTVEDRRSLPTIVPTVTSVDFTGLHEFSVYKVTVTASFNEFDLPLSVPSSQQFTTASAIPVGVPHDVTITTTSRSVSVSWDAIECIDRNGVITGYSVEFQDQGGARIPGEVVNQTFTASALAPHTNYTFRIAAVNINGTGPFTDSAILQTDEDVPGAVSTLTAVPRFTCLMLTWSPPQHPNGVIIAYEVTYTVNDTNSTTINTTDVSTTHTIELGLNTRVSGISVRAYTSVGPGNATMHPNVATPQHPIPPTPLIILAEPLSSTSVNVSWENVTVPGIVSYTVYYRPTETMGGQSEQSVTVPSSESSVVIGDLMTNVEYQFQVAATAQVEGEMFYGERAPPTTASACPNTCPDTIPTTTLSDISAACTCTSDVSITAALTFALTITLCAIIRLVEFIIYHTCCSNRNKGDHGSDKNDNDNDDGKKQDEEEAVYEEVDSSLRRGNSSGRMASLPPYLEENAAYSPETPTESQDNIYAQPDDEF